MRSRESANLLVRAAIACGISLMLSATASGQGALDQVRGDVRTSPPSPPSAPRPASPNDCDDDGCEACDDDCWADGLWAGLGYVAGITLTAPFWGPPVLIGDRYADPGYFAHHPYQYGTGYMMVAPGEAAGLAGPREPWTWAARGRAEYGTDFEQIDWVGGHVLIEGMWRWGLECDFRSVHEDLAPAGQDDLWLGDANVLFRFAQSESLQMRAGLGTNFLSDAGGSDFGLNFTYGGDWLPVQPLVLSGEIDLGTLGSAHVSHWRATAGANWDLSEIYAGYDYYDIGPAQIGGLVAGVRLWY
jgi:hypothetical protein